MVRRPPLLPWRREGEGQVFQDNLPGAVGGSPVASGADGVRRRAWGSCARPSDAASARAEVSQATTRRENASRIADSHGGPSPVGIMVRSVTHS